MVEEGGTNGYTVKLDNETGLYCTIRLFRNVQNTGEIRKNLISGEFTCCMIKAALIVDPLQVIVAANRAALNEKTGQLTTKNLYTELLFSLSMSKNISKSLTEFGIDDSDSNVLMALIHKMNEDTSTTERIINSIKGEQVPLSELKNFTDMDLVKKTYKIEKDELEVSSVADSVVSRISCKSFLSLK